MPESINSDPIISTDLSFTVASGATVSDAVDVSGASLVSLVVPSTFDGTTINFKGSHDGTTFYDIYNSSGSKLALTTAASRLVLFNPSDFAGIRHLKIVCATSQTTTDTVFQLITRPL